MEDMEYMEARRTVCQAIVGLLKFGDCLSTPFRLDIFVLKWTAVSSRTPGFRIIGLSEVGGRLSTPFSALSDSDGYRTSDIYRRRMLAG